MKNFLTRCPKCGGRLVIRGYECETCGTQIRGVFSVGGQISDEQMELIKLFISVYGNIGEFAKKLGVSRPTARARLRELGISLGLNMDREEESSSEVLDALERGEISVEEALQKLKDKTGGLR